jgi:SAM-dependent methyltransferase
MVKPSSDQAPFDAYAGDYDAALAEGLSVSGEDKSYFAKGRIDFLSKKLNRLNSKTRSALDFGCGTGTSTPLLLEVLRLESVRGVDLSPKSIEVARRVFHGDRIQFEVLSDKAPAAEFDLAFCNGVFHHIPPAQRASAIQYIHQALRPHGLLAFWENNPWNPGARYVMSRIPFDRDAITLSPPDACRLVRNGGFQILRTDFLFVFPRIFRWLRPIELLVSRFPLGAQYQVLCRKA